MNTDESMKQAVQFYKSGDKQASQRILKEIVDQDPNCADAWYGLALCAANDEERMRFIQKTLTIDPAHPRALRMQSKLQDQGKQDETVVPSNDTGTMPVSDEDKSAGKEAPLQKRLFSNNYIYAPVLVIMVGLMIWQLIQIDQLKKALSKTSSELASAQSDIDYLQGQVRALDSDISSVQSSVRMLATGLDYVTPLAENANNYAHSHNYSDARLKTRIHPIDDPLSKIMTLRGVYYVWDRQNYPQMNFSDEPQIGLIAQDVEAVFPELVTTDASGYQQVDYERLTAVLVEAIKEQQMQIKQLEQQLDTPSQ